MATGNVSLEMLERMWTLLSGIVEAKTTRGDAALTAALNRASAVNVEFDKGGAAAAAAAVTGIVAPEPGAMTSPGTAARLPVLTAAGAAPRASAIQPPALGVMPAMGDYGAAPVLEASEELTLNGLRNLYDSDKLAMLQQLKASFDQFIDRHFPQGAYFDKAVGWLERALDAQGTGIPLAIESAIWERDRARLTSEAARAEDEALTMWAARGYALPPGALVHGMATIRAGLTNALSAQSRDVAIKVTDVHIENARFAVTQAAQIRAQAMGAATEYIKALMVSPQYVGQWLGALIDGRAKLAGAQADIYRTRAGVATDVFKVGAQTQLEQFKVGADVAIETAKTRSAAELETYRIGSDADRQRFLAELELFRSSEQFRLEQFRTAEDRLLRYFEAQARASTLRAEILTRSGDLSARVAEGDARVQLDQARMSVDAAMEAAKMVATQASAALNNMQLQASASNQSVTSGRM